MLNEAIAALLVKQIRFTNPELEGPLEGAFVKYGELYKTALQIEGLGNEEAVTVASGVIKLAGLYTQALPDMDAETAQGVKDALAEIVGGDNQEIIESMFNQAIDLQAWTRQVNETVDTLIAAAAPEGEEA